MRDRETHYEYRSCWMYMIADRIHYGPVRHGLTDAQQDFPRDDEPPYKWIEVRAVLPWSSM